MKRIYTVQHTQSEHHTNGMVGSWTDWNLTDLGKKQADRIAEKLKQELDGKEIILYTSDLKRAKQTADSIASRFREEKTGYLGKRLSRLSELRDIRFGTKQLMSCGDQDLTSISFSFGNWLIRWQGAEA